MKLIFGHAQCFCYAICVHYLKRGVRNAMDMRLSVIHTTEIQYYISSNYQLL